MLKSKKNQKGFTLVELLIVVVILGILAAVAIPRFLNTRDESQFRSCQSNMAAINAAVEEYCFTNNIPVGAAALAVVDDANRFPDGPPYCPRLGSVAGAYTLDAVNFRAVCTYHGSIAAPTPNGP